ncbi:MAG: hypothetical protein QNJ18_00730 [Xenococcaceae cyanobacterium MO_167.B52]|nr:hypothetical protein [Xenococcaceae cyanobacterium MO_167.B52]
MGRSSFDFMLPTPKHSDRITAGVKKCKARQQQHLSASIRKVLTIDKNDNRLLNPEFVEAIMGFPLGWTDTEIENIDLPPPSLMTLNKLSNYIDQGLTEDKPNLRTRLGQLGNGIVPQVGAIAFEILIQILQEENKMLTLKDYEIQIANLKVEMSQALSQTKKEALSKQLTKLSS